MIASSDQNRSVPRSSGDRRGSSRANSTSTIIIGRSGVHHPRQVLDDFVFDPPDKQEKEKERNSDALEQYKDAGIRMVVIGFLVALIINETPYAHPQEKEK